MIITIISIVIFVGLIIGTFICHNECYDETPAMWCALFALVVAFPLVFGVLFGIYNNINYELDHKIALEKREAIVRRIEQQETGEESITVNGGLYMDIVEYNAKIYRDNKWGKNPWTNWYHGWDYADIDPITIGR